MPIEIRELVIKTTVHDSPTANADEVVSKEAIQGLKKSILNDCKRYVDEKLRDERSR